MHCLQIPQYEDKNYKVVKGREIHLEKSVINKDYLRKKIGVSKKEINVFLGSDRYKFHGIVDEILFFADGSAAPLDYKYATYEEKLFSTYSYQSYMYAILIKEIYNIECKKGFICYVRSNNLIKEINFTPEGFDRIMEITDEIVSIIKSGIFPKKKPGKNRCTDCTYSNICIK
jgi:CRISPR-associated exonuclease Cas4